MPLFNPAGGDDTLAIGNWKAVNVAANVPIGNMGIFGSGGSDNVILVAAPTDIIGIWVDMNGIVPGGSTPIAFGVRVNLGALQPTGLQALAGERFKSIILSTPIPMIAQDHVTISYTTDAGWTGTTLDPVCGLLLRAR